jgi:hypothetical protein
MRQSSGRIRVQWEIQSCTIIYEALVSPLETTGIDVKKSHRINLCGPACQPGVMGLPARCTGERGRTQAAGGGQADTTTGQGRHKGGQHSIQAVWDW